MIKNYDIFMNFMKISIKYKAQLCRSFIYG